MSMKTLKMFLVVPALAVAVLAFGSATPGPAAAWLAPGPIHQYPAEGGEWQYGFWNAKVRSYYNVGQCHGTTVVLDGSAVRSVDTAAGYWSIAEKYATNWWGADDAYYYRVC